MDDAEQSQPMRDAPGDPALLALATVDQVFPGDSDTERRAQRSALEAAAVPHWCDAAILTALIDDSGLLGPGLWNRLKELPVIGPSPAQGADAGCVTPASRLAIKKRLAETQRARFLELSSRLTRLFAADMRPAGRIERIYHLMVVDPEQGTTELADLSRRWTAESRHEDLTVLADVLTELDGSGLLRGRPRVRARLIVAQYRADIAGATSLGDDAHELLRAAEAIGDPRLTADAQSERGDPRAEHAFIRYQTVFEQLTALDPANADWRRELAAARRRTGG